MLNDAVGFEKIFIATGYTDLRRGIDGLASTIKFQFDLDPFQKHILFLLATNSPRRSIPYYIREGSFGKAMDSCFFIKD